MILRRPWALLALALSTTPASSLLAASGAPLDHPLDAAAITAGGDGFFYLTGTDGTPGRASPARPVDFANNDGIRLWRSRDLRAWESVGRIFDLVPAKPTPLHWWRYRTIDPELPYAPAARGVRAPELHRFKDQWLVVFSLNGDGVGLLRSQSGKPEGPFEPVATCTQGPAERGGESIRPLVREGGSASLFAEGDTLYLLWGRGLIAPLSEDLRTLAAAPRQLRCAADPATPGSPSTVGTRGFQLLKIGARYVLLAEESAVRDGRATRPVYAAVADTLFGPYGPRRPLLADAGECVVFAGPDGVWLAAHSTTSATPSVDTRLKITAVNLHDLLP